MGKKYQNKASSTHVELTLEERLNRKVRNYTHRLKLGSGANAKVMKMMLKALDNPCYYCGEIITIDNIQLDHKKPMYRTIHHPTKDLALINNVRNLRFICKNCNFIKDTMPDRLFKKLMDFLNTDYRLKRSIRYKLYIAKMIQIPPNEYNDIPK